MVVGKGEKMKKRKTSTFMKPYLEAVLQRERLPYTFVEEGGNLYVESDISSNRFTDIMKDALCLSEMEQSKSKRLVISEKTLRNSKKRKALMKMQGRKSYTILRSDMKKAEWVLGI